MMIIPQSAPSTEEDDDEDGEDDIIYVLNVDGSLTYKPLQTMCGSVGTSYQQLEDEVEDAIEAGAKTIVMNITSGGGEASHVFETAQNIRSMCDEGGVKLLAYADTIMCSAAYALGVIADVVMVNPSSQVGSIGCVVCLLDESVAYENAGLKRIFITSGENKVPFDTDGTFKKDFLEEIQEDVDEINTQFSEFVSKYTGISSEIIRGFQAKVFGAEEATELGLANGVMTNKEFAAYVASVHSSGTY